MAFVRKVELPFTPFIGLKLGFDDGEFVVESIFFDVDISEFHLAKTIKIENDYADGCKEDCLSGGWTLLYDRR